MRTLSIPHTNLYRERYRTTTGAVINRWAVRLGRRFTSGLPVKKRFDDYDSAKKWLLAEVERKKTQGTTGFSISAGQLEQAQRAFTLLANRATLTEAVEHYVRIMFPKSGTKTAAEAVAAWLKAKQTQGRSKAYTDKIKDIFDAFAAACPGNLNEITKAQVQRFIDGRKRDDGSPLSNNSWNHYRADLIALFNWAIAQGWAAHNPAAELEEKTTTKPAVGFLTPSQALAILNAATERAAGAYLPFFVLSLYTGIRTAELERITWDNVILDDGEPRVIVYASEAKDKDARAIDLTDNAVAWLRTVHFKTGPILPHKGMGADRDHIAAIRKTIGVNWPRNAGRHSFVSYRARLKGEFAAAEDAGHESIRITRKKYKALVSRRAAEAYFSIIPGMTHAQQEATLTQKPTPPQQTTQKETTAATTP